MLVIGIPMILVENVIGRRLRVNSIDAFSDKLEGKNISKKCGKLLAIWDYSVHLVLWRTIWYLVVGPMNYIINLITGSLKYFIGN